MLGSLFICLFVLYYRFETFEYDYLCSVPERFLKLKKKKDFSWVIVLFLFPIRFFYKTEEKYVLC